VKDITSHHLSDPVAKSCLTKSCLTKSCLTNQDRSQMAIEAMTTIAR
jgi:hypothetical protein